MLSPPTSHSKHTATPYPKCLANEDFTSQSSRQTEIYFCSNIIEYSVGIVLIPQLILNLFNSIETFNQLPYLFLGLPARQPASESACLLAQQKKTLAQIQNPSSHKFSLYLSNIPSDILKKHFIKEKQRKKGKDWKGERREKICIEIKSYR